MPEVIGSYSAGCVAGAEKLDRSSNLEIMRRERRRYYGHPLLIQYVKGLASFITQKSPGKLLVGDLALARGGPTLSQHQSHQSGLDADIWYWLFPEARSLSAQESEKLNAPSMVDYPEKKLTSHWKDYVGEMIRYTAERPEVERVLVNPVIKRELCRKNADDPAWLKKVRPWWGHDDHMHVRLACPVNSKDCKKQEPVPQDLHCGSDLDWWFSKAADEEFQKLKFKMDHPKMPILPKRCQSVLRWH